MKSIWIIIIIAFSFCYEFNSSCEDITRQQKNSLKDNREQTSDDVLMNLIPLKILLEHELKTQSDFQQALADQERDQDLKKEYLRIPSEREKEDLATNGVCTPINIQKNVSLSNILSILNNKTSKNVTLNKEELLEVYNSLKNCFFIKVRNFKLWGPLWHCLNRLFLFFVFN